MAKPKTHGPQGHGASRDATDGKPDVRKCQTSHRDGKGWLEAEWTEGATKKAGIPVQNRQLRLERKMVKGGPYPNRPGSDVVSDIKGDTKSRHRLKKRTLDRSQSIHSSEETG
jgi:hypothetical protein